MEHPLHPRLGQYVFEEENFPLTMLGVVGTEAGNPTLSKKIGREIKGSSSTHGKGCDDDDVDK